MSLKSWHKGTLTKSNTKKTQRVVYHSKYKLEKILFFVYYSSRTTQLNWKQKPIAVLGIPWIRKTTKVGMYLKLLSAQLLEDCYEISFSTKGLSVTLQ